MDDLDQRLDEFRRRVSEHRLALAALRQQRQASGTARQVLEHVAPSSAWSRPRVGGPGAA